jgi:hypothetical protein
MGKFDSLLKKLNIDETYTKPITQKIIYDSVKQNTLYGVADMNFMADVIHFPTTGWGYRFLLVILDLGTNEFDIEPLKGTSKSTVSDKEVLEAMKTIFKRKWLNKPDGSIRVDSGNEFKGTFAQFCYDNNILLRKGMAGRHKQMGSIDALCQQLGRLFNGYMNYMEKKTKKTYRNWTDVIDTVREDLNEIRRVQKTISPYDISTPDVILTGNKYNVGDKVFRKLEKPKDALGKNQPTDKFRMGDFRWDLKAREIKRILHYPNNIRYILEGIKSCSYTEAELRPAEEIIQPKQTNDKGEELFTVKDIIGKKIVKGKTYYLIHWEGFKKSEATWELEYNLVEDGLADMIEEYDDNN